MYKKILKRLFDILISFVLLVICIVPFIIISLLIKLDSEGPIVFKQKRLGLHGKVYDIYKFRTMVVNAEAGGVYSEKGDPRVTRVGRVLRATSIDELPQLINIIKGEMSFIGPRPPLTYHPWPINEYTEEQLRMFEVRPGITGWAQINGRKNVEWNQRIKLNVWYVDHISMWLDIKVAFLTVFKVLRNEDNESIGETVVKEDSKEKDIAKK